MQNQRLPRLLYVGDVPVEATVGGSSLLYRLLQNYPVDLCIAEGSITSSQVEKRLPNVQYQALGRGSNRLLRSRFVRQYAAWLMLTAQWRGYRLNKLIWEFKPEAILTVAHGFSWLTAAKAAAQRNLPLHLIVHDDWLTLANVLPLLQTVAEQQFGTVYCQAESRLCVSPSMMESYERQYGAEGCVLYPSRASDVPVFERPAEQVGNSSGGLTFAYAGSIHLPEYAESLVCLANLLQPLGHRVIVYSGLAPESSQALGLVQSNLIVRPLIPSGQLISTLRQEADVLFVPMGFGQQYRLNAVMSFPSKLTDYTATGLPLLVWGPSYCSAVRWAKENPGVAEVVEHASAEALAIAVKKLTVNSDYRIQLAVNALAKGNDYFSHAKAIQQFYRVLSLRSVSGSGQETSSPGF